MRRRLKMVGPVRARGHPVGPSFTLTPVRSRSALRGQYLGERVRSSGTGWAGSHVSITYVSPFDSRF